MGAKYQLYRNGFSQIDLLAAVMLLTTLLAILPPALYSQAPANAKQRCAMRLREVGTALLLYENKRNQFPGYLNVLVQNDGKVYKDPTTGKPTGASFIIMALNELDQPELAKLWRTPGFNPQEHPEMFLDTLVCPADPPVNRSGRPLSYAANCGMADWTGSATMPRDWAASGVFFDRFTGDARVASGENGATIPQVAMSNAAIARGDGLQNTILLTENVDAGEYTDQVESQLGVIWNAQGKVNPSTNPPHLLPPDDNLRINRGLGKADKATGTKLTRPSSYHPGGVNMVFCDGHVKFISDAIDYFVYATLMSSNGYRIQVPGTETVLSEYRVPIDDSWIY